MTKRSMLPRITLCIFLAILCIIVIARVSLATKDEISIEAFYSKDLIKDEKLNDSENAILNILLSVASIKDGISERINRYDDPYVEILKTHLGSSHIELGHEVVNQVADKMGDMVAVINLEQGSDIKEMSLDGREVALHLIEEIYAICGLKLEHNMLGEIQQIKDVRGNVLYVNNTQLKEGTIRIDIVMVVLAVWVILYSFCILFAKKNQLFSKDEIYELDEKEFA